MIQEVLSGKSLNLDTHPSLLPENALAYMLNGDITGTENSGLGVFVQNVASNEICWKAPDDYELLGAVQMNSDQYALFYKTFDSSEIGIFDAAKCAYMPKINNPCLNLKGEIKGRFKVKTGCDLRRVYFIEKDGPIRFIDIDECLPVSDVSDCFDCQKDLQFDCEAFNFNRCVKFPNIRLSKVSGNIPNGVYQIAIALTDDKQRFTDYYIYPEIINLFSHEQATNRFGIQVDFIDCPKGYDEYELVLIAHRDDRGTLAERVAYLPVDQTSVVIDDLDDQRYVPISLEVLFSKMPRYQGAEHIASNNEVLVLGGVKTRKQVNYQPRANRINSKWVVKKVKAKDAHKHFTFMRGEVYGFTINGVYCDGERTREFHLPSDAEEKIKLVPGKWDLINLTVTGDDVYETDEPCGTPEVVKRWQIYDTSRITCSTGDGGGSGGGNTCTQFVLFIVTDNGYSYSYPDCCGVTQSGTKTANEQYLTVCTENIATLTITPVTGNAIITYPSQGPCPIPCGGGGGNPDDGMEDCPDGDCGEVFLKGDFGYWESGLSYPDNPCVWQQRTDPDGDYYHPLGLACQKIRYHKFPDNSTTHIHDALGCFEEETVNVMGVEFYNILPFVDEEGNQIQDIVGYEINVYDRTNNKSILHKGMIYNMFEESLPDCSTSYYANYPFNDLRNDIYLSKSRAQYSGAGRFGEVNYTAVDDYSRNRFQYISPDVSYERNDAGEFLQLMTEENGFLEGRFAPTDDFPPAVILSDLAFASVLLGAALAMLEVNISLAGGVTISMDRFLAFIRTGLAALNSTLPPVNYAMNYLAKTGYESYNTQRITEGNIRRKIEFGQYLLPTKMYAGEDKVNNFQRESGLFVKLNKDVQDPFVTEKSRIFIQEVDCSSHFAKCQEVGGVTPRTSAYYAAVRVKKRSQYGFPESNTSRAISNIIPAGTTNTGPLFGGDVRITKHRYIRKFPFFSALPIGLPIDTAFETSPYTNVWFPRFWLDNVQTEDLFSIFSGQIDNDERNLVRAGKLRKRACSFQDGNCDENLFFRVDGKFFTHVLGEASYWCESEYVADFRERNEIPESNIDRDDEEKMKYRTVRLPELFLYARQFHHRGLSVPKLHFSKDYDCCKPEEVCQKNTIAYSIKHDPLSKGDAWLKFLPNSIQQFSQRDGDLTGFVELDDSNMLFFFEDGAYVSQQDYSLAADNGKLFIGAPSLFEGRMQKVTDDASGFGGCQDLKSVVVTRFGAFWWDRKRAKFVHFGQNVTDATSFISSWAQEYLPKTKEITGVFDNYTKNLYFTGIAEKGDKYWTISYKPERQDFVSFHSFKPDLYLPMTNNFLTVNGGSIWKHNSPTSYQTYYGKAYPFNVGMVLKDGLKPVVLQDLEVYAEFFKNLGYSKKEYERAFFNKMLIYGRDKSTGLKEIVLKDTNNVNHFTFQNKSDLVEATEVEDSTFRINGFQVEQTNQAFSEIDFMDMGFTNERQVASSTTGIDKSPMRGKWFMVHLIQDKFTHLKTLLLAGFSNTHQNIR